MIVLKSSDGSNSRRSSFQSNGQVVSGKSSPPPATSKSGEGNLLRRIFRTATKSLHPNPSAPYPLQSTSDKKLKSPGVSTTSLTPTEYDPTRKPNVSPTSFSTYPPIKGRNLSLSPVFEGSTVVPHLSTLPAAVPNTDGSHPSPSSLPAPTPAVPTSFPYAVSPTAASARAQTSATLRVTAKAKKPISPTTARQQSFMEVDVEEGAKGSWGSNGQGSTGNSPGVQPHLGRFERKSGAEAGIESVREEGNSSASYHTMLPGWTWGAPNRGAASPPSFSSMSTTTSTMTNSKQAMPIGGKWMESGDGTGRKEMTEEGAEEDTLDDGGTSSGERRRSQAQKPPLLRRIYSPSRSLEPEEEQHPYSSPLSHSPHQPTSNANPQSLSLIRRNQKADMRDSWQRMRGKSEMEDHPDTTESEYSSGKKIVLQHTLSNSGGRRLPPANDSGGSPSENKKSPENSSARLRISATLPTSECDDMVKATDENQKQKKKGETSPQVGSGMTAIDTKNEKGKETAVPLANRPSREGAIPETKMGNTAKNGVASTAERAVEQRVPQGGGSQAQRSSPTFSRRGISSTTSTPSSSSSNNSSGMEKLLVSSHPHLEALHSTREEEVRKKSYEGMVSPPKWMVWKGKHAGEDSKTSGRTTAAPEIKTAPTQEGSRRIQPSITSEEKNGFLSHSASDTLLTASSPTVQEADTRLTTEKRKSHRSSSLEESGTVVRKVSSLGSSAPFLLSTFDLSPHPVGGLKKQRNPDEDLLSDISSIDTASLHSSSALLSPTAVSRSNGRSALTYMTNNRDVLNEIEQERNRPPMTIEEEIFVYDDIVIRKDDAKTKHWRLAGRKSIFDAAPGGRRGSWGHDGGRSSGNSSGSATPAVEEPTTFSFNDFDICVDEMDISFGAIPLNSDGPGKPFSGGDSILNSATLGLSSGGGLLPPFGLGAEEGEKNGGGGSGLAYHTLLDDRGEGSAERGAEEGGGDEGGTKGVTSKRSSFATSNGGVLRGNTSLIISGDMKVTWTQTPLSQQRRLDEAGRSRSDSVSSVKRDGWENVTNKGSAGSDNSSEASSQGTSSPSDPLSMNRMVPKKIHNFHVQKLLGHPTRVKCLSISPTEKEFVSCSNEDASVMLYSFAVGSEVGIFTSHEETVICTAFSPDGKLLATSSKDRSMKLWDVMTTKLLLTYNHSKVVICCCFSPDSRYVVSGCQDRVCRLWDTRRGKEWIAFTQHEGIIISVCFSPDSQFVCSSSADCSLRVWTSTTAKTKYTLTGHRGIILSCNYTTDGASIVSNDESQLRVWSTADGSCQLTLSPEKVAGSPSFRTPFGDQRVGWTLSAAGPGQFSNCIIVACNNRFVYVLDRNTGEEILSYFCKAPVYCLSSGWKKLVSFGDNLGNIYMLNLS